MDLMLQNSGKRETSNQDDPKLILKKTKVPINWREAQKGNYSHFFEPAHLKCGKVSDFDRYLNLEILINVMIYQVVDVYGRLFLLLNCDSITRNYYDEMGVDQVF